MKKSTRFFTAVFIILLAVCAFLMPAGAPALAAEGCLYLAWDEGAKALVQKTCTDYTKLSELSDTERLAEVRRQRIRAAFKWETAYI